MRFTHFEAREEDVYTSENETKCGKAVNKQLIAGEYCMSQGCWASVRLRSHIELRCDRDRISHIELRCDWDRISHIWLRCD